MIYFENGIQDKQKIANIDITRRLIKGLELSGNRKNPLALNPSDTSHSFVLN